MSYTIICVHTSTDAGHHISHFHSLNLLPPPYSSHLGRGCMSRQIEGGRPEGRRARTGNAGGRQYRRCGC